MTAKRIIIGGAVLAFAFIAVAAAVELSCFSATSGQWWDFCQERFFAVVSLTVIAFIAMEFFMSIASWGDRKQVELTTAMLNVAGEFNSIHDIEPSLKTKDDCRRYAVRFLDAASALVSLKRNAEGWPKVDAAKFIFAESEIGTVGSIMEWFDSKQLNIRYGASAFRQWPNLAGYSREYEDRQAAGYDTLPEALRNYDSLPDD